MEGKIESIIGPKKSRNGKDYFVLTIGGETLSVWEPSLVEGICEGDDVCYEFSVSGSFKNITFLEKKEAEIKCDYPAEFKKGSEVDTSSRVDERLCEISNKLSVIIEILSERDSGKK